MICILKINGDSGWSTPPTKFNFTPDDIRGWIIAADTHDARRQAEAAGDYELARRLYQNEFPALGKTIIETTQPGAARYIMLVS